MLEDHAPWQIPTEEALRAHYAEIRARLTRISPHLDTVEPTPVSDRSRDVIDLAPLTAPIGRIPEHMRDRARIIMRMPWRAKIVERICVEHGIGLALILSPSRVKAVVAARHAIWVAFAEQYFHPAKIASLFVVDRTSVLHALKKAGVTYGEFYSGGENRKAQ